MRIIALIVIVGMAMAVSSGTTDKKIICYFGSWSVYRPGNGNFAIEDIDPSLCTHLVYTFVGLDGDKVNILDPWADLPINGGKDGFRLFNQLREKNPNLKTLIAIGGWNQGSKRFSHMAKYEDTRERFAMHAVDFVRKYDFDGMDLDWEYPAQRGGIKDDVENYIKLLKIMRIYFDESGYILSAAVAATEISASKSYIISEVSKYLDFINIMTYDFHVGDEPVTDVHAPLYPGSNSSEIYKGYNVQASVKYWLSKGCPKEKLIIGVPLYGRTFTLCDPNVNYIGAAACGQGVNGLYTGQSGSMGYNEICEEFQNNPAWVQRYDEKQQAPYAYNKLQWISYDNIRSIMKKTKFIKEMNLGGVMIWSIETDDFRGICGEKYPLLKTLNRELRNSQ